MRRLITMATLSATLSFGELPVRKVVLYKHGVGYFERSGELRAGESARLDFQKSDMNDVLKSLTIEDKTGRITGLRYDASEPLERRLSDYPFQLRPGQALSTFLDQMKGARLELRLGGETTAGAIVGARAVAAQNQPEKEILTLLLDGGEIRTYELAQLAHVKFADPALQRQLRDYLAALAVARSSEKRSVYIDSTDSSARQITANYTIPMPAWKSSYRLILGEPQSTLEGWAIVDNTTGEDWTNIGLSLVSGRPISFISQLYEPRHRQRPVAELPEDRPVGPAVHAGAVENQAAQRAAVAGPRRAMMMAAAPMAGLEKAETMADEGRAFMASSVEAATQGRELGDLFEYRFDKAVTVRRNESAMLPFLQQKIGVRKLLIYSDRSMQNPMSAAEISNTSGKTLDGGPITVYDGNAYAGEALVETVKSGDKRLISYGVDLGTRITTAFDSSRDAVREIRATRGILTTRSAIQETTTFTIRNVDARAKTLILEQPARPEYKVLTPKPAETTANANRFEVKLPPNSTEKFAVTEEHLFEQSLTLISLTFDQLGVYLQNKSLSPDGRKQLEAIATAKRQLAETDRQILEAANETNELTRDQERIRQNLTSLNRVTGQQEQVNRYAKELADQETRMAALRDRTSQLRRQKTTQEQQLNALIEKISF